MVQSTADSSAACFIKSKHFIVKKIRCHTFWLLLQSFFILIIAPIVSIRAQNSAALPSELNFESGISYRYFNAKGEATKHGITYMYSQSGFFTMELIGILRPAGTTVFDVKSPRLIRIDNDNKTFAITDFSAQLKKANQENNNATERKISRTGKTDEILGYHCEEYMIERKGTKVFVWATSEINTGLMDFAKSYRSALDIYGGFSAFLSIDSTHNAVIMKLETQSSSQEYVKMEALILHKPKRLNTSGYSLVAK